MIVTEIGEDGARRPSASSVMLVVAAVDAADGALLGASFPAFEQWLNLSPSQLGTLMMVQTVAGCVMLPVWGWALRRAGYRNLLMGAVSAWAASTLLTTISASYHAQCALRVVNGASLSCVLPLSQALLAETTAESRRGRAFGLFAGVENAASIGVGYAVVSSGSAWRIWYYVVFAATIALLALIQNTIPPELGRTGTSKRSYATSVQTILSLPSFWVLVAQGVVAATPWKAIAFLNLLWLSVGYSHRAAASITSLSKIGAVFGSVLGGRLGDIAAQRMPSSGRIVMAQAAKALCIPLWIFWLRSSSSVTTAVAVGFTFNFVSPMPRVTTCQPICAELVEDPADRANIVALWVFIFGAAAGILGGPFVGYLVEWYGYRLQKDANPADAANAVALRRALTNTGSLAWGMALCFWTFLYFTLPKDKERIRKSIHQYTDDYEQK